MHYSPTTTPSPTPITRSPAQPTRCPPRCAPRPRRYRREQSHHEVCEEETHIPVLSFEIFGATQMGRHVKEVMKPADIALLTGPRCAEPTLSLSLLRVHTEASFPIVVERMRYLSDVIAYVLTSRAASDSPPAPKSSRRTSR